MDVLMKYHKDMHGKEVIDTSGNVLGKVKDIEWDESTKQIKLFSVGTGGIMEMLGRGETKILPFDIIDAIGEKILIKTVPSEITEERSSEFNDISRDKNDSMIKEVPAVKKSSNVKDSSIVTHTSRIKDVSKLNIAKIKGFNKGKETKKAEDKEKVDDNLNLNEVEDTIENFRIRNSF